MKYASQGNISKFEYASYLAASLSYLLISQRDAAGLGPIRRRNPYIPPARSATPT